MKKYIYIIAGAVALFSASCGRTVNPDKKLKTGLDSFSYSLGINVGNYLKQQGLDKIDYSSLIKGIEDKLKKDSGYAVSEADMQKIKSPFFKLPCNCFSKMFSKPSSLPIAVIIALLSASEIAFM